MSGFHESEGSLSSKLDSSIQSVNNTLSRGLTFNSYNHISHEQLKAAASEFVGLDILPESWWETPFNRDPDTPDDALPPAKPGLEVYFRMNELIEDQRRVRNMGASQYQDYKKTRKTVSESYEHEIEFGKSKLILESYNYLLLRKIIEEYGGSDPGLRSFYEIEALQKLLAWWEIYEIITQNGGPQSFWISPQFSHVPFYTIRATLMAADITRYPERKPEPSLQDDFSIVATILPYSDVFATEKYIAQLIKQTKMDKEYSCRVFTMREKYEFLTYLEEL